MEKLRVSEVLDAVKGKLVYNNKDIENIYIEDIKIDSREELKNCLFIPIKGENFDGHNFLHQAVLNGASCLISEVEIKTDALLIIVDCTFKAIKDLAKYYRSLFNLPVVAITGSTGKTTTKDMVASVLGQKYKVLKTMGNFNNEIGLPLTIFNLDDTHECIVLEMGMNHKGEIHNLSEIGKPSIGVITNIGTSHIENLGDKNGIRSAKFEIFDFLQKEGIGILNGDDEMLHNTQNGINNLYFGTSKESDIYAYDISHEELTAVSCTIKYKNDEIKVKVPMPGMHMVYNALCAALIGFSLNLSKEEIKKGIEAFEPTKMRMDIINTGNVTIINDVYNASLESMKASIDVLSKAKSKKVAILGDMLELGEHTESLHKQLGEYVASKDINLVVCAGESVKFAYEVCVKLETQEFKAMYFKNKDEAIEKLESIINKGDTILVKASRGLEFESVVEKIKIQKF
jgi:UDP-N-acetylmuramoyl-tripeptide--D-alanyl-D-alanine ligase